MKNQGMKYTERLAGATEKIADVIAYDSTKITDYGVSSWWLSQKQLEEGYSGNEFTR
jgi:hypothetical protein